MGFPGMWELLVILVIVLLIFGPKRIKGLGADLGNAIKGFRKAVTDDEAREDTPQEKVIEGDAQSTAQSGTTAQGSSTEQNSKV